MLNALDYRQQIQDSMMNMYKPINQGQTVMERLQFRKKALELELARTTESLEAVNKAIAKLEADPNLDAILSLLGKANIL